MQQFDSLEKDVNCKWWTPGVVSVKCFSNNGDYIKVVSCKKVIQVIG